MKKDYAIRMGWRGIAAVTGALTLACTSPVMADIVPGVGFNVVVQNGTADPLWTAYNAIQNGNAGFNWEVSEAGGWVASQTAIVGDGWSLDAFEMEFTTNPSQTNAFTFTNNTGMTDTFTVTFTTLGSLVGPSSMFGSIAGGLTDNFPFTGATFGAPVGGSVYTALIDGNPISNTLWDFPYSVSTSPPALTASLGSDAFNFVTGPGVVSSISIVHEFTLSAGDSVTIDSAFVVVPFIPGPGGLIVLLGGFAMARRRRR